MSKLTPIHISLSPNTESDDIKLAAHLLRSPHRWSAAAAQQPFIEAALGERLGDQSAMLVGSGRAALYEALRAAGIGEGHEVIVQAFTCLAVPAAVSWTGATPIYADIAADTYNLSAATVKARLTPRTKALIIQHTFGIPAPLNELLDLARERNLFVIEDVAHSLGGTFEGQPLGSFGHAAILSFGRDKTISSVFGGAIATRHESIAAPLKNNLASHRQAPMPWVFQQLLHPLIVNAALPLYFTGPLGKILLVAAQRARLLSLAVSGPEKASGAAPSYRNYQMHPALLALLKNQLNKLDRFTAHRRQVAERYLDALGGPAYLKEMAKDANWLRFPITVKNKLAALAAAKEQQIILGDWYSTPVAPVALNQQTITHYIPGSCPVAEEAALHTINLPTHPRLTGRDVERVITFMQQYIAQEK